MDDKQLVKACKKGNVKAQKALYERYAPKIKGICMRYAANAEEAEDILQEAFIRIFTKMDQYNFEGPLGAWIRRIAVNTSAEIYRKEKKVRNQADIDDYSNHFHFTDHIIADLNAKNLTEKINALPDGYRVVFNLFAVEGYSHKEIGEMLGVSENTSKSQYCRARAALRKMIEHEIEVFNARVG